MRREEIAAAGRLAGDVLASGVGLIEDLHRAIAQRVFAGVGPVAEPVRAIHDSITRTVYGTVGGAHALAPLVGAMIASLRAQGDEPGRSEAPGAQLPVAVLNGLWGDTVADRYPELAVQMTVRQSGRVLSLDEAALEDAFPDASSKIVVFVHGLCETDKSWRRNADDRYGDSAATYGSLLQRDRGYSPVYLRYNSGLHVSDNGRRLAALLDELVTCWPVGVEEIVLVGHSMGGLIARSACYYGQAGGRQWTRSVAHVFCLGTPHLGAPLEKGVHVASWLTGRLPETRPIAKVLNARSAGVKDLRFGACVEDDWRDCEPDELLRDRCTEVPFLPQVAYYFIGASVTADANHPVAALVGDLLVRLPSASGNGRRRKIPFEIGHGCHVGGLHHLDLLNHPAVYEQLLLWLSAPSAQRL